MPSLDDYLQQEKAAKASAAAFKANETSGAEERSRKANKAGWTKAHGKDDANNPFSFHNYYSPAEQEAVRAEIAERSAKQKATSETVKTTSSATPYKRATQKASDYPTNWKEIGVEIRSRARNQRGQEQCECCGECQKHAGRCEEINGEWPKHRRSKGKVKVRFTVAHLCHTPECDNRSHLKAMCEPCHLIYDLRCRQRGLCGENAVEWARQAGQI